MENQAPLKIYDFKADARVSICLETLLIPVSGWKRYSDKQIFAFLD